MTRIVVQSKVGSDGVLHLHLPVGAAEADKDVQVTVETAPAMTAGNSATLSAVDLLQSGLIGMWAGRTDIVDSREYARRLRALQPRRKDISLRQQRRDD